jgi:hypothetical protein
MTARFAIVEPIANKETETVAKAVVDRIFPVHGYADLQADSGTEFRNQYLNAIVQLAGQEKFHTTVFKPSTNGEVEKFHRFFNSMLAKVVAENQRDWPEHIKYVVFSYNACSHQSTGLSPVFLMTGQQPKWNVDLLLDNPSLDADYDSLPQFATDLTDKLAKAYHLVRQHLHVAAERNRTWFNRKVKERTFQDGDRVRVYVPKRVRGRCPKLQSYFRDVGNVVRKLNDATYVIHCKHWKEDRVIHVDKLRLDRSINGVLPSIALDGARRSPSPASGINCPPAGQPDNGNGQAIDQLCFLSSPVYLAANDVYFSVTGLMPQRCPEPGVEEACPCPAPYRSTLKFYNISIKFYNQVL